MPRCGTVDSTSSGPEAAGARAGDVVLPRYGNHGRCGVGCRNWMINASLFKKGNQAGDGARLIGNNFLEHAALRPGICCRRRSGRWRNRQRGCDGMGFRKNVGRQSGVKMRCKHVNVGTLIHELTEGDLDGKLLADGEGDLRQG